MMAEQLLEDQKEEITKVKDEFKEYKKDFDQKNEEMIERLMENERNFYKI